MKRLLLLLTLGFSLTACLQTRNEKVELTEDLQKRRLEQFIVENVEKPFSQLVDEQEAARKRETIYEDLRVRMLTRKDEVRAINEQLEEIPEDPFASYEAERIRVLNRHWTDVHGLKSN